MKACCTCRHWEGYSGFEGVCKRLPPVFVDRLVEHAMASLKECGVEMVEELDAVVSSSIPWCQPITPRDGWCGEWQQGCEAGQQDSDAA